MVWSHKESGMKLFFETAAQASLFLSMLPIGFCIAVCIDLAGCSGRMKHLWDVLVMLLCFGLIAFSVVLLRDNGLRLYHFLSVLAGALLYLLGVRSLLSVVCAWIQLIHKKHTSQGRNP